MNSYTIFTLFPSLIEEYIQTNAPLKRGVEKKIIDIKTINFRDYAQDHYKKVDDTIYGGSAGLLLKADVIVRAVEAHLKPHTKVFLLDPKGEVYNQDMAKELSEYQDIFLLCGRYEGFDARVKSILKARSVSVGDFVLTGGELGALSILDSTARLHKGVCLSYDSVLNESFMNGLLESDQYTKPYEVLGKKVPDVLISGHHKKIKDWEEKNSLINTIKTRPELFKLLNLESIELDLLRKVIKEMSYGNEYR